MKTTLFYVWLTLALIAALGGSDSAYADGDPIKFVLQAKGQVNGEGVFLSDVVLNKGTIDLPRVHLAKAPAMGQTVTLNRAQLTAILAQEAPTLVPISWEGAPQIQIARRVRSLKEAEIKELLAVALQRDHVKAKGELEINFSRAWATVNVPDETLSVAIKELPTAGLGPNAIVRFVLSTPHEVVGEWQQPVHAKIWRSVWVVRSAVTRGQVVNEDLLARERRDMLVVRDTCWEGAAPTAEYEFSNYLAAGSPLYAHAVRLSPVVHRGQLVDARLEEGSLLISLKVEVLEDGAPGQTIRVRNPKSKQGFQGKVQNEHTILVVL